MTDNELQWPPLPLASWIKTKDTLHLYLQIVGKIRLLATPYQNHWWHATLFLTCRGLETSPMPYEDFTFNIEFDFINHLLEVSTSKGFRKNFPIYDGLTVAQFYAQLKDLLAEAGVHVKILAVPYMNKSKIPFAEDQEHYTYDANAVHRFWQILVQTDMVLKEFSGRFIGKQCPVHLYWHSFDLVITWFNGKKGPAMNTSSRVEQEAYSHEVISFGFWPGDDNTPDPAFYSYTYLSPKGLANEPLSPPSAKWVDANGSDMALLMYDSMREEPDPHQALLDFMESAYTAGAKLAGWDRESLDG